MKKTRECFTDLYAEKFSSPKEFVGALKRRKSKEDEDYPGSYELKTYYKVSSYEEAYPLFLSPWNGEKNDIEERFEKRVEELRKELQGKLASEGPEKPYDRPWWWAKPKHPREAKKREFVLGIEKRVWPYKTEETEDKVLTQLACIALLERDYGWRCAISTFDAWHGKIHTGKDTELVCLVNIKKAEESFDIKKIACPALHPSMELLTGLWQRTLSAKEAMGEEYLKCKGGWGNWYFYRPRWLLDYIHRDDGAIFVDCDLDLVSALPRLIKPVIAGTETKLTGGKGWAPYGWLETLPCGDEIAYLRRCDRRDEFARYYIAENVTVAYYDKDKRIKGDKTKDLLEEREAWEMVN